MWSFSYLLIETIDISKFDFHALEKVNSLFLDRSFGFLTCYTLAETEQHFHSDLLDFSTRREFEIKSFKRRMKLGARLEELNK